MNATASQMYNGIRGYYSSAFGSGIQVTKTMFDTDQNETTNETLCVKAVYNVTLTRYINGVSVSNIMSTKTGSSSTITFNMPDAVQTSGAPLGGNLRIRCMNALG
jgi:uncharacterized membrane protein